MFEADQHHGVVAVVVAGRGGRFTVSDRYG